MLIDTHTHLYLDKFQDDIESVMKRAAENGVEKMFLPNIDHDTISDVFALSHKYPYRCYPMVGLHPSSVGEDYESQLIKLEKYLDRSGVIAVGEIGIDLYWDKTFEEEQIEAFKTQIKWALVNDLPIVIHSRNAMQKCIDVVGEMQNGKLRGVFHCFDQDIDAARQIIDLEFYLGLGGVLTFKKSKLPEVVKEITLDRIILETDSPYLTPAPHRGKRNESAYVRFVAEKLAEVKQVDIEDIEKVTTENAQLLFNV